MANASLLKLWGLLFGSTDQNDASVEKILQNLGLTTALAAKQPLDNTLTALSGKSVSALLEYLGLGEVINLAGGALQKNQNLADLTDKTEALENLGLGTVVSDTRLGQHEVISGIPLPGTYSPSTAIVPAGAVMTGTIQESRNNAFIFTASITYRRVQKLINGVWTNVDAI